MLLQYFKVSSWKPHMEIKRIIPKNIWKVLWYICEYKQAIFRDSEFLLNEVNQIVGLWPLYSDLNAYRKIQLCVKNNNKYNIFNSKSMYESQVD